MEYVIFSDVHGNSYVLCELLKREESSINKRFIFCGDICGYYYEEEECIRLLEGIPDLIIVRGNHDQYYLDAYDDNDMTERLVQKYGSSYRSKNENVYSYIEKIPISMEVEIRGRKVYVQHGSNIDPIEGRVYPDTKLDNLKDAAVYIAGHTHYQMFKRVNDTIWINPGSLGQPRDGKGFVYCVMDEDFNVTYHRIDIEYFSFVKQLISKYKITHFLPTSEAEIIIADREREFFTGNGVKVLINNKSIIEICTSKYKTAKFLQSQGIDAPLTYHAMEYSAGLNYPFIMKSDNGCGSKHLKIIRNEEEWIVADKNGMICQQIIGNSDTEYTVGVFSDGNNVNSIVLKRQLGYGGLSTLVECCDVHEIDMIAEKTAKAFRLKGSFNIQLRKDGEKFYIFEINPRLSSTAGFRHKFGFQDAVWWFDLVDGKAVPRYKNSCVGSVGVKVLDDVVISKTGGGYWKNKIIQYSGHICQVMVA